MRFFLLVLCFFLNSCAYSMGAGGSAANGGYTLTRHQYRFLDTNCDGTGTKNANGNYSSAAQDFCLQVPLESTEKYLIYRLLISIRDSGALDASSYGNGITLSNGVTIKVYNPLGEVAENITDDQPVFTNADYAALCYDSETSEYGTGDNYLRVRFTLAASGYPIVLEPGAKIVVRLNDDFTGLISHRFMVQGLVYDR